MTMNAIEEIAKTQPKENAGSENRRDRFKVNPKNIVANPKPS